MPRATTADSTRPSAGSSRATGPVGRPVSSSQQWPSAWAWTRPMCASSCIGIRRRPSRASCRKLAAEGAMASHRRAACTTRSDASRRPGVRRSPAWPSTAERRWLPGPAAGRSFSDTLGRCWHGQHHRHRHQDHRLHLLILMLQQRLPPRPREPCAPRPPCQLRRSAATSASAAPCSSSSLQACLRGRQ